MKKVILLALFLALHGHAFGQCVAPSNYMGIKVSTNSAEIDLRQSGQGPWEIEYGVSGFTLGAGNRFSSSDSVVRLQNLSPASVYKVYLRRSCGGLNSAWNTLFITTNCQTVLGAPVRFDFESAAWNNPGSATGLASMGSCWTVNPQGSGSYWSVGPPHQTLLNTGPKGDHSTGLGQFLHFLGNNTSQDSLSQLFSPSINLAGLSHPRLKLWYHMFGAGIDSMQVLARYRSVSQWDTLYSLVGQQQAAQDDPWLPLSLSLSSYKDSSVNFQIVGYAKGMNVHMALDDFSIYDSTDCEAPSFFRAISVDDQSVLLDWDPGSGSTHTIEYGGLGFGLGNGTQINVGAPPYRVTNLSADSSYVFFLRDNCGSKSSAWSRRVRVHTDCSPIIAPHFEDFEGNANWPRNSLKPCWDRFKDYDYRWQVGPPALSYTQSGPGANNHTPGGYQFIVAHRPNQKGDVRSSITSPWFNLDSLVNPELIFWTHMFGGQISALDIEVDSGDGYSLMRRIIGPQQISKSEAWDEQILDLSAYGGKQVKVKFTAIASNNWASLARVAIDDFWIGEAPACRKPTNLRVLEPGFTTTDLDWLSGGAQQWMIRLEPSGGNSSYFGTSNNPLSLNNLLPGTEYTLWVRDSCGAGLVSDWSAPISFKTYCLPDSAPYFQDFEGSQFVVQSSFFSTGTLHPCWERSHELGPVWQPSPSSAWPSNQLPSFDKTTGSGKYLGGVLYLGNGSNHQSSFTSPHIDISGLSRPEISFWYFLGGYSFNTNKLELEVNNGSGWQLISTINGPVQSSTSDAWLEQKLSLSAFTGDTIRLRFSSIGNTLYATTAAGVDDISIYNDSTCHPPSNLRANYVSSTGVNLSWSSGGASNWNLRFRALGENDQFQNAALNDSFDLQGLLPNTPYEIWVRDSCNPGISAWHGPIFITTDCLPTGVPFSENFDGSTWIVPSGAGGPGSIDACWRRSDTVYSVWTPNSGGSASAFSGPANSRSGTGKYLMNQMLQAPPSGRPRITEVASPLIANVGLLQPELNYDYHLYGAQILSLKVYVERMDDSRVLIDSLIGPQQSSKTAAWQRRTVSLAAFNGDTFKVVFVGEYGATAGRANMALDEVEIVEGNCSVPQNLSAANISFNSADLLWSSLSSLSTLEYGTAGFNLGSGTRIAGVSSGYNLGGLLPFTTYAFYVQDSCNSSNSTWAGPCLFTTQCSAPLADFSHQSNGLNLNFDGRLSSGIGLNYTWDFGDGNFTTGAMPNHSYANPGNYAVQLIATDTCGGADTLLKNIQVCELSSAVIGFQRSGLRVFFDGQSSVGADLYFWQFDTLGTSNGDTVSFNFPGMGTYTIMLVVSNACGDSDTSYLNLDICDKPSSDFSAVVTSIIFNTMVVSFDGTKSKDVASFVWDFGDGAQNTSTLTPVHVYATANMNYVVSLITTSACGLTDTMAYALNSISLPELENQALSVYPNPAEDRVTLEFGSRSLSAEDLQWFDAQGKQQQVPLIGQNEQSLEFDVSALAAGVYFLVVKDRGAVKVEVGR